MIKPILEPNFKPAIIELRNFQHRVNAYDNKQHLIIAIERDNGFIYRKEFDILPDGIDDELNIFIIERLIKSILWVAGGYRIYIAGSHKVYETIHSYYQKDGLRSFDYEFFKTCYEREVEVVECDYDNIPNEKKCNIPLGGHLDGRRIGFDAGGTDRKCSAVLDGKVIYSEEVVWEVKTTADINYHYDEIYKALRNAIDKLGGDVDGIGISTAGVIIDNRPMVSSLFINVPKEDFEKVKAIYIAIVKRLEKELGHPIPYVIANDGDVTALAGAIDVNDHSVLGISMGTSQAGGYINEQGYLNGWINELAFFPVDFNKDASVDEWSHDFGVGCKYFSQDAVIRLAESQGFSFKEGISLGEKLKSVQEALKTGKKEIKDIYQSIGVYLGYTIAYYLEFYKIKHLMLLGRVMSDEGGEIIIKSAKEVLDKQFPEYSYIDICTPSDYMRRVGQAITAASLPKI